MFLEENFSIKISDLAMFTFLYDTMLSLLNEEKLKGGNMAVIFGVAFLMAVMIAMYMGNDMAEHIAANPDFHGSSGPFGHGAAHGFATSLFLVIPVIVVISLFERRNFK